MKTRMTQKKILVGFFMWISITAISCLPFMDILQSIDNGESSITSIPEIFVVIFVLAAPIICTRIGMRWLEKNRPEFLKDKPPAPPPPPPPSPQPPVDSQFFQLCDRAVDVVFRYLTANEDILERKLNISRTDAARIIKRFEECEIIGAAYGNNQRKILAEDSAHARQLLSVSRGPRSSPPPRRRGISMARIDKMEGHDFEEFTANLLRKLGYENVRVTPSSGDQGVDVLAVKDGKTYAIQCKRYAQKLGNKPVQEVHAGKTIYGCSVAVVMTNSYFTEGGKEAARALGVELWDRDELRRMLARAGDGS